MSYAYFDGSMWIEGLTAHQIKGLASNGVIKRDTLVRIPNGKEVFARIINGIEFGNPVPVPVPISDESQELEKYDPDEKTEKTKEIKEYIKTKVIPVEEFCKNFSLVSNIIFAILCVLGFIFALKSASNEGTITDITSFISLFSSAIFLWLISTIIVRLTEIVIELRIINGRQAFDG